MNRTKWLLLAGMAILLMTMGCDKQLGFTAPQGDDIEAAATSTLPIQYNPGGSWFTYVYYMPGTGTEADPIVYPLSVGNDNGTTGCGVGVWDDGTNIYVHYFAPSNWWFTQVHVDIGTAHDSLRHNGAGNLNPGKFRFPSNKQFNLNPYVHEHTVTCEWQDSWYAGVAPWEQGDAGYDPALGLLLCAHSIVCQWDDVNQQWVNFQTGTGAGGPPPPPPNKVVNLPTATVNYIATHPYPATGTVPPLDSAYWDVLLSNVPGNGPFDPYNVWNGHWKGWCTEHNTDYYGWPMSVTLISSQDPNLNTYPRLWKNGHWDRINWLLNHKSDFPTAHYWNFQNAFYLILGDILPNNPKIEQLDIDIANAAEANGVGYIVPPGGWIAVLLWDGYETPHAFPDPSGNPQTVPNDQLIFIEVDP